MSSEIDNAIELIEEKIAALQRVRDTLVEMFDPPDSLRRRLLTTRGKATPPPEINAPENPAPQITTTNLLSSGNGSGRSKRKDEVATFIREHGGSASRAEIIVGTGIPKGTIAYVLNDISRFRRRDHKWHVREQRDSARTPAE